MARLIRESNATLFPYIYACDVCGCEVPTDRKKDNARVVCGKCFRARQKRNLEDGRAKREREIRNNVLDEVLNAIDLCFTQDECMDVVRKMRE